jgi:hypothetical protein
MVLGSEGVKDMMPTPLQAPKPEVGIYVKMSCKKCFGRGYTWKTHRQCSCLKFITEEEARLHENRYYRRVK